MTAHEALVALISKTAISARRTYGGGTDSGAQAGILVGLAIGTSNPDYAQKLLSVARVQGSVSLEEAIAEAVSSVVAEYPIPDEEEIR